MKMLYKHVAYGTLRHVAYGTPNWQKLKYLVCPLIQLEHAIIQLRQTLIVLARTLIDDKYRVFPNTNSIIPRTYPF